MALNHVYWVEINPYLYSVENLYSFVVECDKHLP